MGIVGGLDVHRRQITFDYLDEGSGVVRRGRIEASREILRRWLATEVTERPARFAVEACTGWRFVVEELAAVGVEAHLAEPADTAAARGPKRRAKTDRLDARHLSLSRFPCKQRVVDCLKVSEFESSGEVDDQAVECGLPAVGAGA